MNDYFHARWYVDSNGVLQRRTVIEQQRIEYEQMMRDSTPEQDKCGECGASLQWGHFCQTSLRKIPK